MDMKPEPYKAYWATVAYHRADDLRVNIPADGQRILVRYAWLMNQADNFPGEVAFLVEQPVGFPYWIPERDLLDFELASTHVDRKINNLDSR